MTAYAILLRGVNVGGSGSLPMASLREVLTDLGYDDVRTYLQSGNAVFTTSASASTVHDDVAKGLATTVGREISLLVRTHAQLTKVVDGWPFATSGTPTTKHVVFLDKPADAKPLKDIDEPAFAPEKLSASGTHVYLSLPNGLGRSKLAPIVNRKLAKAVSTMRNWNTVTALAEMTAG
jgi:uncharacterized protein (DUF1697 family)